MRQATPTGHGARRDTSHLARCTSDVEHEIANVGASPSVYRRALSVYTDNSGALRVWGIVLTSVCAASAVTGTALLPIGLSKGNDGPTLAGGLSLGAGAALIAFGVWAINADAGYVAAGVSGTMAECALWL